MSRWIPILRIPVSIGILLGLWQLVYLLGLVSPRYFPSIVRVAQGFVDMIVSGELFHGELLTFSRAAVGLAGAAVLGIALALASDLSPVVGRGARLISGLLQPLPPAALVPMAVFALGLGWKLYAFVIILVTIWPPFLNGAAAFAGVSPIQIDTGRMIGLSRWDVLWHIKMPAALPEIFTGIRYAATISLIAVIVSEMLAGRDGLGFMIFRKAFALRTAEVYALMFVVAANGLVLNRGVGLLRRLATGWHIQMAAQRQ